MYFDMIQVSLVSILMKLLEIAMLLTKIQKQKIQEENTVNKVQGNKEA